MTWFATMKTKIFCKAPLSIKEYLTLSQTFYYKNILIIREINFSNKVAIYYINTK